MPRLRISALEEETTMSFEERAEHLTKHLIEKCLLPKTAESLAVIRSGVIRAMESGNNEGLTTDMAWARRTEEINAN